jgi:hypothetical protein
MVGAHAPTTYVKLTHFVIGGDNVANVFKAREAYKKVHGTIDPNKPIIAVRGLYVAGMWRPPYWIDTTLNMTKIGGLQAADVVYYTASTEYPKMGVGVVLVDFTTDVSNMTIRKYSTSSDTRDLGVGVALVKFETDVSNITYTKYTRDTQSQQLGVGVVLVKFETDISNMNILKMQQKSGEQPPGQPLLNIKTHSTTNASIT